MHQIVTTPYADLELMLHPSPEIWSQYSKSHSCVTMKRISQPALGKAGYQLVRNISVLCPATVLLDVCRRHMVMALLAHYFIGPQNQSPDPGAGPHFPLPDGVT